VNDEPDLTLASPEVRKAFFRESRTFTPYVAAELDGGIVFVKTRDNGVSRTVFLRGSRVDTKVLGRVIDRLRELDLRMPPDPVFVDLGANIGTTTVLALRRFGFATAVAVEPEPENFRLLRANLVMNDLDERVCALPFAAGATEGELLLWVARRKSGINRVVAEAETGRRTITAEAVSVDGLVARGVIDPARVGLFWVDVVGHEQEVLRGATTLFAEAVPIVTAYRPDPEPGGPWPAPDVLEALASSYSEVMELRKLRAAFPIEQLGELVGSLRHPTDLLFLRR
jgi:FkbM family methyltransferase